MWLYQPGFGLINGLGNLGGFIGPWVLGRLDRYRDNEIPRVQLAILKLSAGDLAKLDRWIETACRMCVAAGVAM